MTYMFSTETNRYELSFVADKGKIIKTFIFDSKDKERDYDRFLSDKDAYNCDSYIELEDKVFYAILNEFYGKAHDFPIDKECKISTISKSNLFVNSSNKCLYIDFDRKAIDVRIVDKKYQNNFIKVNNRLLDFLIKVYKEKGFKEEELLNNKFKTKENILESLENNPLSISFSDIIESFDYLNVEQLKNKIMLFLDNKLDNEEIVAYLFALMVCLDNHPYKETRILNLYHDLIDRLDGLSFGIEETDRALDELYLFAKYVKNVVNDKDFSKDNIERFYEWVCGDFYRIGIIDHEHKTYFVGYEKNPKLNYDYDYQFGSIEKYDDEHYQDSQYEYESFSSSNDTYEEFFMRIFFDYDLIGYKEDKNLILRLN